MPDLTREAVDLLCRELGVANTWRVLRQFREDTGNYTDDREDIPLEKIVAGSSPDRGLAQLALTFRSGDHVRSMKR